MIFGLSTKKSKKILLPLLSALLLCLPTGCGVIDRTAAGPSVTRAPQRAIATTAEPYEAYTDAANSSADPAANRYAGFTFSGDDAIFLGSFESEIYGALWVYLQNGALAFMNEYGSIVRVIDACGAEADGSGEGNLTAQDMDFDGYTDFSVPDSQNEGRSLCWLWDRNIHTFVFSSPLSALPDPVFVPAEKTIYSVKRVTSQYSIETAYQWIDGILEPVAHWEHLPEQKKTISGAKQIDPETAILDDVKEALIILTTKEEDNCRWLCGIEDTNVVRLSYDLYDEEDQAMLFAFRGVTPGTTTVVFRYTALESGDYLTQKTYNIIADDELTLTVVAV